MIRALLIAALLASASCEGSGGAVSVRWRIVDLSSGQGFDPRDRADRALPVLNGEACSCPAGGTTSTSSGCAPSYGWTVHAVRIEVRDPLSGAAILPDSPQLTFPCSAREATTPFILPEGTFALSLRAYDPMVTEGDGQSGPNEAVTPAPVVRAVKNAEIASLDVVEVGVGPPAPDLGAGEDGGAPPDGGAADLAVR